MAAYAAVILELRRKLGTAPMRTLSQLSETCSSESAAWVCLCGRGEGGPPRIRNVIRTF